MEQSQKRKRRQLKIKIQSVAALAIVWVLCAIMAVLPVGSGVFFTFSKPVRLLFGQSESKGIYQGSDHMLFEEIKAVDKKALDQNIAAIQSFSEANYNTDISMLLVPSAANIQAKKLPASAVFDDQSAQLKEIKESLDGSVTWVDAEKALLDHKDEEIFYHTDAHWTSLGAYYSARVFYDAMKLDAASAPNMKSYVVNNHFNGALSKESGYEKNYQDSISIYSASDVKDNPKVLVENISAGEKMATLYDVSKLDTANGYDLFLGGNAGAVRIITSVNSPKRLLILKDSFANCMVPFLTPFYHEIVMIDVEEEQANVQSYLGNSNYTDVLFLCSANTFVTNKALPSLLENISTMRVEQPTQSEQEEQTDDETEMTSSQDEETTDEEE